MASRLTVSSSSLSRSPRSSKKVLSDSAYSDSSEHSVSELKDVNVKLRSELDSERNRLRQLHRDKQLEVRHLEEKNQTKLAIALKELRSKLHHEKAKEIMQIKEAQQRKMETELHKIVKQKDMEIYRLQGDRDRLQQEIQEMSNRGLSGGARGVFVAERTRLAREVHELRSAKSTLEDQVVQLKQMDKQSRALLRKYKDEHKEALESVQQEHQEALVTIKADYDSTIKSLETELEEYRTKTQNLEESLLSSTDHVTQLLQKLDEITVSRDRDLQSNQQPEVQEKGPPGDQKNEENKVESQASLPSNKYISQELEELQKHATQLEELQKHATQLEELQKHASQLEELQKHASQLEELQKHASQLEELQKHASQLEELQKHASQLEELQKHASQLEELISQLKQENSLLEEKLREAEGHLDPMKEKVRSYLEKNMILSAKNLNIDEQLQQLKEDYHSLHHQLSDYEDKGERIIEKARHGMLEEGAVIDQTELKQLQECIMEQDKTIEALKVACNEKDRRIEVLVQRQRNKRRQRKAQQKAAGIKETYFGYDEDKSSIDSESVSSYGRVTSPETTLDEDIADELSRAEFEQSYQRLLREHLELEKAFALLQAQSSTAQDKFLLSQSTSSSRPSSLTSPDVSFDNESKPPIQKEAAYDEERQRLCQTIRKLQDKLAKYRGRCEQLQGALQEAREQTEEMEFRLLEMQETRENGKSPEDQEEAEENALDEEALKIAAEYADLKDMDVAGMVAWLRNTKASKKALLDLESQHAGLQAETLIHNITNKLEEANEKLQAGNKLLEDSYKKIHQLETKARLLEQQKFELESQSSNSHTDLVFAHEQTLQQLQDSQKKLADLEAKISQFEKAEAVYKYTEDYNKKTEQRLTEEISTLRRQLQSSNEGRNYEAEFIKEKLDLLKVTEQKLKDYETKQQKQEVEVGQLNDLEQEVNRLKVIEAEYHKLQEEHAELTEQISIRSDDDLAESDKYTAVLLANLKSKVVAMEAKEAELLEKTESLYSEVTALQVKVKVQDQAESHLKHTNMSLQDEVKEAKDRIHRLLHGMEVSEVETRSTAIPSTSSSNDELEKLRSEVLELRKQLENVTQMSEVDVIQRSKISDLEKQLKDLENENVTLKNDLKVKDLEIAKMVADLDHVKQERQAAQKDLERSTIENTHLEKQLVRSKTELAQLKLQLDDLAADSPRAEKIQELQQSEKEWKEKCQSMEGAIVQLRSSLAEAVSKEQQTDTEVKSLLKSEISLRLQLEEYVEHDTQLEQKIQELEENNKSLQNDLEKVGLEKVRLANKLQALHDLEEQVKDLSVVKGQTQELEHVRLQLQEKLQLLQSALDKEREKSKEQQLHLGEKEEINKKLVEQVSQLQDTETALKVHLESQNSNDEVQKLRDTQQTLQKQVTELQVKLSKTSEKELQAKDAVALIGEEKDRHIDHLTDRITKMEDNEARLMETIHELEEMEKQLQAQLRHKEVQEDRLQEYEVQISKFHERERELLGKIEELSEAESTLNSKLSTMELAYVTKSESKDNRSYKDIQKIIELENKIQQLSDKEAKLLEQTYTLKMENQDLQEQLEQMASDVESLASPRSDKGHDSRSDVIENLRSKVKELEQQNEDLKNRLLQSKLDAMETMKGPLKDSDLAEVKEEMKKIRRKLDFKLEENQDLQEKLIKLRSENVRQESRQGELEEEVKRKTQKCERLENKNELLMEAERKLMERIEELEAKETKLKMENTRLKAGETGVNADEEKDKEHLQKRINELEEQVQELQGKRQALKVRLSRVESSEGEELQRLREKVDLLLDTEEKLLDRLQEQEQIEAQLTKKLKTAEGEVRDLEEQLQKTHNLSKTAEELSTAIDRIAELEQEVETLRTTSDLDPQSRVSVKTEVVQLKSAPSMNQYDLGKKVEVEDDIEQLKKKEKAYLDHIEELEEKLEESEELLAKLRTEVDQSQLSIQELEEEIAVLKKDDKSAEVTKARTRVQQLEDSEKVMKKQMDDLSKTVNDLEDKMTKLQASHREDLKEAQSRIDELEDAEEQLQEQLQKVNRETKELKDLLASTKLELKKSEEELRKTQEESKILKEQLRESEVNLNDLEAKLAESAKELKDLQRKTNKQEESEKELKNEISKMEEIKSSLQEKLTAALENEKLLQEKLKTAEKNASQKVLDLAMKDSEMNEKLNEFKKEKKTLEVSLENEILLQEKLQAAEKSASEKVLGFALIESQLNEKLNEVEKEKTVLEVKVTECEAKNKELAEKLSKMEEYEQERLAIYEENEMVVIDKLQKESENEKLLEKQVRELEAQVKSVQDSENELKKKVQKFDEQLKSAEGNSDKLKTQLKESEELQNNLNVQLAETARKEKDLAQKIDKLEQAEKDLQQKLKIAEINEKSLKEKIQDMEGKIQEYNKLVAAGMDNEKAKQKLTDLEESNKKLRDRITDHEKSGSILQNKWLNSIEIIEKLEKEKSTLEQKLKENQDESGALKTKLSDLEKTENDLQAKVKGLEKHNLTLMQTLQSLRDVNKREETDLETVVHKASAESFQSVKPEGAAITSLHELDTMTKQHMMSRIQELEYMEKFHLSKITRLQENLENFRSAVETVTYHLEADTDIPVLDTRPKTKDSEYEAKVQELVRSEVLLRSRVHEQEKDLHNARLEVAETKKILKTIEDEHKREVNDLEDDLNRLRKSEARLKNTLNYGGATVPDGDPLAKIQHLESLVFDLEDSERKLKRRIQELLDTEQELRSRLEGARTGAHGVESEVQEKDRHYELMTELRMVEMRDRDLKDKLSQLEKEDRDALIMRIAEMERKERALKRKIEIMEMQGTPYEEAASMETPEAVLKQRVRQLERIEKHLRTQVVELERDREELHDITRKDKNSIHDLNVQLRELQLSENNLKEQVNRYDVNESHLQLKLDDLTERLHDLEDQLRKHQVTERHLKAQLHKYQYSESDLNIKFESIIEESRINEDKLRKKIGDLEREKRNLTDKTDELVDKVSDLEGMETTLKQKLRSIENNEASLQGQMKSLEMSETAAKLRVLELESLNEQLSERAHKLEEEKSNLMYEISELELSSQERKRNMTSLQHMVETLKEKLNDNDVGYESMASRLQDALADVADLTSKIEEYQHAEREWQEKFTELEKANRRYRQQIEDLEVSLSAKDKSAGLEEESSFLNLRLAQVQKDLQSTEEENLQLHDKLKMFETSMANHQMATLPVSEVNELREKSEKLRKLEIDLQKLERTEKNLRKTIEDMRSGKSPCGHDLEIKELKDQVNKYNSLVQEKEGLQRALNSTKKAHELLKNNYEDVKIQLGHLHKKIKTGEKSATSNKSIQAQLEQTVSLRDITPELKNALKNLGAKHPEVYQEFIQSFIPETPIKKTQMTVNSSDAIQKMSAEYPRRQLIGQFSDFSADEEDEDLSLDEFLSDSDSSVDEDPIAGVQVNTPSYQMFTFEKPLFRSHFRWSKQSTGSVKAQRVQDFVDNLPERKQSGSEVLWKTVESHKEVAAPVNHEETLWANIENAKGEYDDMTIGMSFNEESDISDSARRPTSSQSVRSTPPPLPVSTPPVLPAVERPSSQNTESYYLPSSGHPDSADEASDLDEDPTSLRAARTKSAESQSKSMDRDSDFSESVVTKSSKRLSGSLDSVADSGMGTMRQSHTHATTQKLMQLEKLLKTKEKELELANANMRELEKKLENSEPQSKAKREIHIHKQFTVNQTMEAEMTMTKAANDKTEEIQILKDEIERLKNFIKAKETTQDSTDKPASHFLLENDLKAKEKEVARLKRELEHLQEECHDAHDQHQKALSSMAFLEDKVATLQQIETRYIQLQKDHTHLEELYTAVMKKQLNTQEIENENADLEEVVMKLRGQVKDLERIDLERDDLETKLRALEQEVKNMKSHESELKQENSQFQHELEVRKKDMIAYRSMELDYQRIRSRFEDMERTKAKAESLVTPLRAKVIRLAQKCRIKDDLIERLLAELRRHGDEGSAVVAEADRVQSQTASEEYNRPLSPIDTALNSHAFEDAYSSELKLAPPSIQSTIDPDTLVRTPALRSKDKPKKRLDRPHSVDVAMIQQGGLTLDDLLIPPPPYQSANLPSQSMTLPRRKAKQAPPSDLYTAIKDYEPRLFSDSGHETLELPLVEGQVVRILGPVDQRGYHEAEVNGKIGLVPGRYLAPLYPRPPSMPRVQRSDSNNNQRAPEQILSLHDRLHKSHVPLRHAGSSAPISTITHPAFLGLRSPAGLASLHPRPRPRAANITNGMHTNTPTQNGNDGAPEPPCRLEVQRVVGHSALLLSWIPPIMDEFGCSNGAPVKGYKLYINGRDKQQLSSPYMTKALVENLNLQRPLHFSMQTVGQHGRMSRPIDAIYEHRGTVTEDTDASSVLSASNLHESEGERRVFLAVYDYNPAEHSPNSYPDNELAFHTGDIITTYGNLRSDGFYQAKVKGRRGLVPASFIQEVALLRSHSKRNGSTTSSMTSQHRPSSQSSLASNHSTQI